MKVHYWPRITLYLGQTSEYKNIKVVVGVINVETCYDEVVNKSFSGLVNPTNIVDYNEDGISTIWIEEFEPKYDEKKIQINVG